MERDLFSAYNPPISSAYLPVETLSLDDVWERITDNTLKGQTDYLRSLLSQNNTEEYKRQKGRLLPSVTFGGVFDYRSTDKTKLSEEGKVGLLQSSGLVIIDIDHLSEL